MSVPSRPIPSPAAVVLDFFMRLGWAFVISPDQRYVAENYMLLLGN